MEPKSSQDEKHDIMKSTEVEDTNSKTNLHVDDIEDYGYFGIKIKHKEEMTMYRQKSIDDDGVKEATDCARIKSDEKGKASHGLAKLRRLKAMH